MAGRSLVVKAMRLNDDCEHRGDGEMLRSIIIIIIILIINRAPVWFKGRVPITKPFYSTSLSEYLHQNLPAQGCLTTTGVSCQCDYSLPGCAGFVLHHSCSGPMSTGAGPCANGYSCCPSTQTEGRRGPERTDPASHDVTRRGQQDATAAKMVGQDGRPIRGAIAAVDLPLFAGGRTQHQQLEANVNQGI
ncbi:unnamed protein product [Arctogadus glacialis]